MARRVLTNPDAPLDLDHLVVKRYLTELVAKIDGTKPELGGTRLTLEEREAFDRSLALWCHEVYGAITSDRYRYAYGEDGGS